MTRFNFLGRDRLGEAAEAALLARAPAVRIPLLLAALSLLLLGLTRALEDWRVFQAAQRVDVLQQRESALAGVRKRVRVVSSDLTRLLEIRTYVRDARRSGYERAAQLAYIGNSLPAHVWLTAIRDVETGWALTGGALQVSDVGSAMLALDKVPEIASTTLVSAHATDRRDEGVQYEIRLGRRR